MKQHHNFRRLHTRYGKAQQIYVHIKEIIKAEFPSIEESNNMFYSPPLV